MFSEIHRQLSYLIIKECKHKNNNDYIVNLIYGPDDFLYIATFHKNFRAWTKDDLLELTFSYKSIVNIPIENISISGNFIVINDKLDHTVFVTTKLNY